MAGDTVLTRHDLEAKIVKRCREDEAFRKEFTSDPAGAFVKYLEVPAESLPKIVIHEESPGSWQIVLPVKPSYVNELSEQDLERVVGGESFVISTVNYVLEAGYETAVLGSRAASKSAAVSITAAAIAVASVTVSIEKTIGW
jgi:hypothetical protein